jgi:glycerol-3-phosphate acyltransferase PlsY
MSLGIAVLDAVLVYLIGSISFARLVTRFWAPGKEVTNFEIPVEGTEDRYKVLSIGANSVSSVLGSKAGMVVSILDILKILIPTLLYKLIFPEQPAYALIAAITGMIGHIWPVYYQFHGGSGFSALLGGLLVIDWLAVFITPVAGLFLGMVVFRNMVAANLMWMWLLIPWFWWRTDSDIRYILYAVVVNILFMLAMIPDIKMAMKYRREGKYIEYGLGSMKSHSMGRSMLKIAKFFRVEIK